MGRVFYIGSTGPGSGRSLLAWMLAESLLARGFQPGFFKCVPDAEEGQDQPCEDPDLLLFGKLLGQDRARMLWPSPGISSTPGEEPISTLEDALTKIQEQAQAGGCAVVMGSPRIFSDSLSRPISEISLIQRLRAEVFLLDRYETEANSIYSMLSVQSLLKGLTRCLIINRIPFPEPAAQLARIQKLRVHEREMPSIALIPEDRILSSLSIGEICRCLPAHVLTGGERGISRISRYSLETRPLQGPLKIFRHTVGRILLIEPEDKCTTEGAGELRESLAGILLTGQRLPSPALIEAAREAGIALLHCPQDRFAVLDRLQQTLVSVRLEERYKKERFQELILRDLGIAHILACSSFTKDSVGGG